MDVITLPRDLYSDRHDDEDRVFVTGPTLEAAARLWIAQDPTHRNIGEVYLTSPSSYVFTWKTEHESQMLLTVTPDEDMEQLYPADELPFGIVASPFAIGDIVTFNGGGQRRTVITVQPDGVIRAEPMDNPGVTLAQRASEFTLVRTAAEAARLDSTPEPAIDAHTALQHVVTFPEGTNIVTIDRLITACIEAGAVATPVEPR